jgi:hypothetical protein
MAGLERAESFSPTAYCVLPTPTSVPDPPAHLLPYGPLPATVLLLAAALLTAARSAAGGADGDLEERLRGYSDAARALLRQPEPG